MVGFVFWKLHDKKRFKCTNEAAIGKPLEIANSDNNRPIRLQLIICPKTELLFSIFYEIRANMQQVLPAQIGLYQYDE